MSTQTVPHPNDLLAELERLEAALLTCAYNNARLRVVLRDLIGENEVYHGNVAAGTWERARAALEGK